MIELGNIIYKYKKAIRFYLCSPYIYQKDFKLSNEKPKRPKSLYIKIVSDDGQHTSWIEMPHKLTKKRQIENDYQIYFATLVNEYGYSLSEHQKSYLDKVLKKR